MPKSNTPTIPLLTGVVFRNWMGISAEPKRIEIGAQTTVLVGPNNAGKSILWRTARLVFQGYDLYKNESAPALGSIKQGVEFAPKDLQASKPSGRFEEDECPMVDFHFGTKTLHLKLDAPGSKVIPTGDTILGRQICAIPPVEEIGADIGTLLNRMREQLSSHRISSIETHLNESRLFEDELRIELGQVENLSNIRVGWKSERRLSLDGLGAGLTSLLSIVLYIKAHSDATVFFIDEPESHLHPKKLRELVAYLQRQKKQLVVSTHSTQFWDMLRGEDVLISVSKTANGTVFDRAENWEVRRSLLDDLGIQPSSLMLANCIVWVEGPTDRRYLLKWLSVLAPEFREGVSFSICFYGGAVLSHFASVPTKNSTGFVDVASLSNRWLILMDRDSTSVVGKTKQRIHKEALRVPKYAKALLTSGWMIESDIPGHALESAVNTLLAKTKRLKQVKYSKTKPSVDPRNGFTLKGHHEDHKEWFDNEKMNICIQACLEDWEKEMAPRSIRAIVAFIRRSNTR